MIRYILDTSALLCYLRDEPGADKIYSFLKKGSALHRVNLGELYYCLLRKEGSEIASQIYGKVLQYPVTFIDDLSDAFLLTTGKLKVSYKLGYADAVVAATAILQKATLVTKDNDFRPLVKDKVLTVQWV